jgi:hypothetical protein
MPALKEAVRYVVSVGLINADKKKHPPFMCLHGFCIIKIQRKTEISQTYHSRSN